MRDAGYLIFNPNTLEGDSVTDTPDLRGVSAHPMKSFFGGLVPTRGIVSDRFSSGRAEPSFHLVARTIISISFCLKISMLKKKYLARETLHQSNLMCDKYISYNIYIFLPMTRCKYIYIYLHIYLFQLSTRSHRVIGFTDFHSI